MSLSLDSVDITDSHKDRVKSNQIAKCIESHSPIYQEINLAGNSFQIDTSLLERIKTIQSQPDNIIIGANAAREDILMESQETNGPEETYSNVDSVSESTYQNSVTNLQLLQGSIPTFDLAPTELREQDEIDETSQPVQNIEDEIDSFCSSEDEEIIPGINNLSEIEKQVVSVMMTNLPKPTRDKTQVTGARVNWGDAELFSAQEEIISDDLNTSTQTRFQKEHTNTLTKKIKTGVQEMVGKAKSILANTEGKDEDLVIPSTSKVFSNKKRMKEGPENTSNDQKKDSYKTDKQHQKEISEEFKRMVREQTEQSGERGHTFSKAHEEYTPEQEAKKMEIRKIKGKSIPGKNMQKGQKGFSQLPGKSSIPSTKPTGFSTRPLPSCPTSNDFDSNTLDVLLSEKGQHIIELSVSKAVLPQITLMTQKMDELLNHIKAQDKEIHKLRDIICKSGKSTRVDFNYQKRKMKDDPRIEMESDKDDLILPPFRDPANQGIKPFSNLNAVAGTSQQTSSRKTLSALFGSRDRRTQLSSTSNVRRQNPRASRTFRVSKRIDTGYIPDKSEDGGERYSDEGHIAQIRDILNE